jgi:hypothetical protein
VEQHRGPVAQPKQAQGGVLCTGPVRQVGGYGNMLQHVAEGMQTN